MRVQSPANIQALRSDGSVAARRTAVRASRRRGLRLTLWLAILAALSPLPTSPSIAGQNPASSAKTSAAPDGAIRGTVRDIAGAVVPAARITLIPEGAGARQATMTAVKGNFAFAALPQGSYTLEVEAAGFRKSTRSHLVVSGHESLTADFALTPGANDKAAPDSFLGGFNYYDDAELKPSGVGTAVDPGGYSASREVDNYRLMLDYAQAEGLAPYDNRPAGAKVTNGQPPVGSVSPPTAAGQAAWSEDQFLARGSDLLLGHDLAASMGTFQAGVARFPNSAKLATGLGIALEARGEHEKAIASLLHATDLAPSDPRAYFVLARAYSGSPTPTDEVPNRMERLVNLDPHNAEAYYDYAMALAKTHATDPATLKQVKSLLKNAVALDPNLAEAHLQLGILYAARSSYTEAISEYKSAIRLKPDLAAAHYRLAQAYQRTGDKSAAQAEMDLYERLRQSASSSRR